MVRFDIHSRTALLVVVLVALLLSGSTALGDTEEAKELYNQGLTAQNEGNTEGAILNYRAAIEVNPDYVDAYLNLGAIYFEGKDYQEALQQFMSAAEKDPSSIDAHANVGRVQYKLKRYLEAATSFKAAIAINDSDADLWTELGKVYYYQRNYGEVIPTIEKSVSLGGGDYRSYYMLGKAYQKTGQAAKAIASFEQSIQKKSKNASSHFALGSIYLSQEKYNKAASAFKASLSADPNKYMAAYNYAIAVETVKPNDKENVDTNIANWEAVVRVAKNHPKAKDELAVARGHVRELKEIKKALELQ